MTDKQIPANDFQVEVFRGYIDAHVAAWPQSVATPVVGDYRGDGVWALSLVEVVVETGFAPLPMTDSPEVIDGAIWLEDQPVEVVVAWNLGNGNEGSGAPQLAWAYRGES